MTKYSIDFKVKVIGEYFEGMGCASLCYKCHIPSDKTVLSWVHRYQAKGMAGIKSCDQRPEYTCNFKLKVLQRMRENHSPLKVQLFISISLHRLRSINGIDGLKQGGVDGLKNKRGRPPMGKNKHLDRRASKNDKAKNPLQSDAQRLKDLELENELFGLRMNT
ncbi:transposase [Sporolactobacillus sp. THM19-2]|jgi:hypothetical protein|uniref:transposase n=1 Tax=Sporolactobacillus sp. THM19-2 TaxID=2511171 RepID=UPI001F0E7909|nr:transposase [Sporolactobacillus sp. THM19-2]